MWDRICLSQLKITLIIKMLPLLFNCGRFLIEQGGECEVSIFLRCDTLSYSFTASSFIFVLLWKS